jgi:GcrA cell cycle regulator
MEPSMSWTDERVDLLKKMWLEGRSASQIAKELGSVTRNAVIGKVHRLGLSSRGGVEGAEGAEVAAPVAAPEPAPAAPVAPVRAEVTPPVVEPDDVPEPDEIDDEPANERETATVVQMPVRRPIVPAGQPLPPQPAINEISPETLANVREVEKTARRLSLMELTERTCKWPIGDPATDDFWFCGLPSVAGKPYCDAHVSVAFQPMQARRDRRR